ncbi:hypothetical protein BESB_007900 [Besnoitia besnoiti]|uniref:Uncharacterized protein n=1 Tax=Besnoitia besnoiti TaxID=94643 RepID=A0A2A9MIT1_BESBE|nr:hypothetical protein BESB_007900 [Besnoitia besnoiti]PFH38448.1 hypothetical protein BESB_007900 [Besnoitia besnoiti]
MTHSPLRSPVRPSPPHSVSAESPSRVSAHFVSITHPGLSKPTVARGSTWRTPDLLPPSSPFHRSPRFSSASSATFDASATPSTPSSLSVPPSSESSSGEPLSPAPQSSVESPAPPPSVRPSPLPFACSASPSPLRAVPAPPTPLPFALFKEANTWVESLIARHLLETHKRGRRNEPPREGPSLNWDLLADGRILKRRIEGGEGDLYPSARTNVTIEFSLHTLSGYKIADNRDFNTTMMEFPFENAMPGMQIALASMRKLERAVFLLSPETGLPLDFSVDLATQRIQEIALPRQARQEAGVVPPSKTAGEASRRDEADQVLEEFTVRGGEWLAFDIKMCNIYDSYKPWWRISPDREFLKNLPVEHIPENMTHGQWLELKSDQVRDKIQDEMSSNPHSPYWDDIEPAMNDVQREKKDNYTRRLYGLDTPPDPRRDGSRGFRDSVLGRSGGMRHGCEMGDRMMGKAKHYVWRESMFNFEIVLFVREGIRAEHISWDISSRRLDIFFGGKRVFGDEFVHPVDHGEGATWTLTEAATKHPAMPLKQLHALYDSTPLDVPQRLDLADPSLDSNALRKAPIETPYDFPRPQPIGQLPDEETSYMSSVLLSTLRGELEDPKLPVHQPAMHITLPKASNWREMWGNPFKFV